MKIINQFSLLFCICLTTLLIQSCIKNESCPTINCNIGTFNEQTCDCICPLGFSGTNCEIEDICVTQAEPCQNGGTCINGTCDCLDGYLGTYCESYDSTRVQFLLDGGKTPLELFRGKVSLDSIYGKTYAGGLIFHLDTLSGTGLVAAIEDETITNDVKWGCNGILIEGADGYLLGTGAQNTIDIVMACNEEEYAAKLCYDLDLNGYTDWFLPSWEELNLMWLNLADSDGNGQNAGPSDKGNLGGFASGWYWSSTESYAYAAHFQIFANGIQDLMIKNDKLRVRAARAY